MKHGFEDFDERVGDNTPLDEYGLSMLAICVDMEGKLKTCTCRWNHGQGGNDHIMSASQISEVIKMNFKDTFIPVENVDRSLSYEDYYEMCVDDRVYVWTDDYDDVFLSQDLDYGQYEFIFDETENAKYYLYNNLDDSYPISSSQFNRNSLIQGGRLYSILKDNNNDYTVVYSLTDCDDDIINYTEYAEIPILIYDNKYNVCIITNEGRFDLSSNYGIKTGGDSYVITSSDEEHFICIHDINGGWVFSEGGECLISNEEPLNGKRFEMSDGKYIKLACGKSYDVEQHDYIGVKYKIDEKLFGNYYVVLVGDEKSIYNAKTDELMITPGDYGFEWIKEWENVVRVSDIDKQKCNMYSLKYKQFISPEWGDGAGHISLGKVVTYGLFFYDSNK